MGPVEERRRPEVNYLRLSITDRCNLACFYCRPRHDWVKLPAGEILRYEEFLHLARVAADAGIRKIRVTGGEPLVRRGVVDFLGQLGEIPGIEEICLTTNGVLLSHLARDLYAAGVRHLNLSLDSLRPDRFRELTGGDHFHTVISGLNQALSLGFAPLKINCVILKDLNDDEVLDFADLARRHPVQVRFIEFMPTVAQARWDRHFLPMTEVARRLARLGPLQPQPSRSTAGPARIFKPAGFRGELGFITPMSDHHCPTCNRLRLTAAGRLRACLFAPGEIDLKGPLRRGASTAELSALFREAMARKEPLATQAGPGPSLPSPAMVSIGG
jgi:cyclic pyranopterin phosphate synthase